MNKKKLQQIFLKYSSVPEKELPILVDEYISDGRRRKIILKLMVVILVVSICLGAFAGFVKSLINLVGGSFFSVSGIIGGLIGILSVSTANSLIRKDIRGFLKSKNVKNF
jgi:MFS family permease